MKLRFSNTIGLTFMLVGWSLTLQAAQYQSSHFSVSAPGQKFAVEIAERAERALSEIQREWFGEDLPWTYHCTITVWFAERLTSNTEGRFGPHGQLNHFRCSITGEPEDILEVAIPNEVLKMLFIARFQDSTGRQLQLSRHEALPPWLKEGVLLTIRPALQQQNLKQQLRRVLQQGRGLKIAEMTTLLTPPRDPEALNLQSYGLCSYLLMIGGREKFVEFLDFTLHYSPHYQGVVLGLQRFYRIASPWELQVRCEHWVLEDFPGHPAATEFSPLPQDIELSDMPPTETQLDTLPTTEEQLPTVVK